MILLRLYILHFIIIIIYISNFIKFKAEALSYLNFFSSLITHITCNYDFPTSFCYAKSDNRSNFLNLPVR